MGWKKDQTELVLAQESDRSWEFGITSGERIHEVLALA